jgi:peptidoglycan/LPS O-acetylase OafA/YrhL
VFPFLVRFLGKYGPRYIAGIIGLMLLVRGMMFISDGTIADGAYWTIIGRFDQFAIGMLMAWVYAKRRALFSSPVALALAAVAVYLWIVLFTHMTGGFYGKDSAASALWIISPTIEAVVWSALAMSYLQQKWGIPRALDRTLSYMGTISFSMYMWHFPIIVALNKSPELFLFRHWYIQFLAIDLPLMIAVSSLSYFVIEKPFFSLRKAYVRTSHMPDVTRERAVSMGR